MQTFLTPQGHAYVILVLPSIEGEVQLDCLIDTGFSGGLAMPQQFKEKFNFPRISRATWELGDGSQIESEIYLGELKIRDNSERIAVIFSESREVLVGIEFLRGKRFVLDLKKNTASLS